MDVPVQVDSIRTDRNSVVFLQVNSGLTLRSESDFDSLYLNSFIWSVHDVTIRGTFRFIGGEIYAPLRLRGGFEITPGWRFRALVLRRGGYLYFEQPGNVQVLLTYDTNLDFESASKVVVAKGTHLTLSMRTVDTFRDMYAEFMVYGQLTVDFPLASRASFRSGLYLDPDSRLNIHDGVVEFYGGNFECRDASVINVPAGAQNARLVVRTSYAASFAGSCRILGGGFVLENWGAFTQLFTPTYNITAIEANGGQLIIRKSANLRVTDSVTANSGYISFADTRPLAVNNMNIFNYGRIETHGQTEVQNLRINTPYDWVNAELFAHEKVNVWSTFRWQGGRLRGASPLVEVFSNASVRIEATRVKYLDAVTLRMSENGGQHTAGHFYFINGASMINPANSTFTVTMAEQIWGMTFDSSSDSEGTNFINYGQLLLRPIFTLSQFYIRVPIVNYGNISLGGGLVQIASVFHNHAGFDIAENSRALFVSSGYRACIAGCESFKIFFESSAISGRGTFQVNDDLPVSVRTNAIGSVIWEITNGGINFERSGRIVFPSTLTVRGGTLTLAPNTIPVFDDLRISAGAAVIRSATWTIDSLSMSAGTLQVDGNGSIDDVEMTGGTWSSLQGTGALSVNSALLCGRNTKRIQDLDVTFLGNAVWQDEGELVLAADASFVFANTSTFSVLRSFLRFSSDDAREFAIINFGTINIAPTESQTGTITIIPGIQNRGLTQVRAGTVIFEGGFVSTGRLELGSSAKITLAAGAVSFLPGSVITNVAGSGLGSIECWVTTGFHSRTLELKTLTVNDPRGYQPIVRLSSTIAKGTIISIDGIGGTLEFNTVVGAVGIRSFRVRGATVFLNTFLEVLRLDLESGRFQTDLDLHITEDLQWSGGSLSGTGEVLVDNQFIVTGDSHTITDLLIRVAGGGFVTGEAGSISLAGSSVIENLDTSTLIFGAASYVFSGTGRFINRGTINLNIVADNRFTCSIDFENIGNFSIVSGQFFSSGFFVSTGRLHVTSDGVFQSAARTSFGPGSFVTGNGELRVTGDTTTVSAASFSLNVMDVNYASLFIEPSVRLTGIKRLRVQNNARAEITQDPSSGLLAIEELSVEGSSICTFYVDKSAIQRLTVITSAQLWIHGDAEIASSMSWSSGYIGGDIGILNVTAPSVVIEGSDHKRLRKRMEISGAAVLDSEGQLILERRSEFVVRPAGSLTLVNANNFISGNGLVRNFGTIQVVSPICPLSNRLLRLRNHQGGFVSLSCSSLRLDAFSSEENSRVHMSLGASIELASTSNILSRISGEGFVRVVGGRIAFVRGIPFEFRQLEVVGSAKVILENAPSILGLQYINADDGAVHVRSTDTRSDSVFRVGTLRLRRGSVILETNAVVSEQLIQLEAQDSSGFGSLEIWDLLEVTGDHIWIGGAIKSPRRGRIIDRRTAQIQSVIKKDLYNAIWVLDRGALVQASDAWTFSTWLGAVIQNNGLFDIRTKLVMDTSRSGFFINNGGISCNPQQAAAYCRLDTTIVTQSRIQVRAANLDLRGGHETRTGSVLDLDSDSVVQFRNRYVVDEDASVVGQGRIEVLVEDGNVAFTGLYTQNLTLQQLTVNANPIDMSFYLETPLRQENLPSISVNRGRFLVGSNSSLVFRPSSVIMSSPSSWDHARLVITDGMAAGRLQISNARLVAFAPVSANDFVFTAGVYEGWQTGTFTVNSNSVWLSSGTKYLTGFTNMTLNGLTSMNEAFYFEIQNMCVLRNRGTLVVEDAVTVAQASSGGILLNDGTIRVNAPALTNTFNLLFYNNKDFTVAAGTSRIQNSWIVGGNVSSSAFGNILLNTNGLYFRSNATLGFKSTSLVMNTGNLRIDVEQIPIVEVTISGGSLSLFSSKNNSICLTDLVISGGSGTRFIAENPLSVDSLVVSDQAVLQSNFKVSATSTLAWSNGQIVGSRDLTLFGSTLSGDCITGQNLLGSPSCDDSDISAWTQTPSNPRYWGCTYTGVYDRIMFWSGSSDASVWRTLSQEVDVSALALDGVKEMYFECWARSGGSNAYTQETLIEFLDASKTVVGTLFADSLKPQSSSWRKIRATKAAPSNTRFVRVKLTANYYGYWDNFFLGLAKPPFNANDGFQPYLCYTSQGFVQIKRTENEWARNVCSGYTNCASCSADVRCGWSGLGGQCEEGTRAGPRYGVDCNWIFDAARCPAACSTYNNQNDCEDNICTWCPTGGCQQRGAAACRGEVTLVWNNARGGLLEDANNWLPVREPTSSDILLINIPGDYTVFTNQDTSTSTWLTVRKIIINNNRGDVVLQIRRQVEVTEDSLIGENAHLRFDANGHLKNARNLTVQGRMFVVDANANLFGAGPVNVFGFLDMNRNGAFYLRDGKTLTVFGRSTWNTGYRQSIMENARLVFARGSSNFMQANFEFNSGTGTIVNEGELVYSPVSPSDNVYIYFTFTNTGTVRIERGFFRLYASGIHSGEFNVSADGTLALMGTSQSLSQTFTASSNIHGDGAFQCGPEAYSQGVQVAIDSLKFDVDNVHIRSCKLVVSANTATSSMKVLTFGWYFGFAQFVSTQKLTIADLRLEGEGHRVMFGGDVDVTTNFRMTTNTILDGSGALNIDTATPSVIYGGIITGTAGRMVTFGSRTVLHIEPQREIRFTRVNMTANCDIRFDNHNSAMFFGDDFRLINKKTFFYNGTGHDTATTGNGLSTTINEGRWIVNMDVRTNWFNYFSNFINFGEINVMAGRFSLNQGGESFGIVRTSDVDELSIRHHGGTFVYRAGSRTSGTGTIQLSRGTTEFRGNLTLKTLQVANEGLATIFEEAVVSGLENLRAERNIYGSPQATLTLRRPITVPNAEFLSDVRVNVNAELRITESLRHNGHIFASRNITVSGRSFYWAEGTLNFEGGASMDLRETPTDFTGSGDRAIRGGNVMTNGAWRSTHLSWLYFETGAQLQIGAKGSYVCDRECRVSVRNGGVGMIFDGRLSIESPGQSEFWSTMILNSAVDIKEGTLLLGGRVLLTGSMQGTTLRLHGRQSIVFTNTSSVSIDSLTAEGDTWGEMLPIAVHSTRFAVKSLSCPMPYTTRLFQIFTPNTTIDYLFSGSNCDLYLPAANLTIPRIVVRAKLRLMNTTVTSSQFFIEEYGNVYSTSPAPPQIFAGFLRFAGGTINNVNVEADTFDLRTFSRSSYHMYLTGASVLIRKGGSWQASNQWINLYLSRSATLTIGAGAQVDVEVPTTISGTTTENFVVLGNLSLTHMFGDTWVTSRMINRGVVSITRRQLIASEMLNIDGRVNMEPSAQVQFRDRTSIINQTGIIEGGSVYHFSGRLVCQPRSLRLESLTIYQGDVDVLNGVQEYPIAKDVLLTYAGRLNLFARIEVPTFRQTSGSTVIRVNSGGSLSVLLRFEWTSGYIQGASSALGVVVRGRVVLSDTSDKYIDQAFLEVRGSGAWTQGQIILRNNGELRVNPGAKFDLVSTSAISGQGTFNNGGECMVQACGSTVQINVALLNSGTMNCRGNLRLNAGGTNMQDGSINLLTTDTDLEVYGGTLILQDFSDVTGVGFMEVGSSAIVSVGGGVASVGFRLLSPSARLTVNGDTNMTRPFDWKAGIVSGAGVLSVYGLSTWDGGDCQGVVEWHNEVVVGNKDNTKFVTGVMIVRKEGVLRHGAGNIIVTGRFTNDIGGLVSCEPQGVFSFYCSGAGVIQNIGSMVVQAIEGQQYTLGSLQNFGTLISRKGLTRLSGSTRLNVDSQLAGAGNFTCTASDNLYLGGSIKMSGYLISETCNMYIKGPAFFDGRVLLRGAYLRYSNPTCQAYYDVFNPQALLLNPCPEPELIVRGRLEIDCSTFTCDFSSGASLVNQGEIYYTGGTWSLGERFENNGVFVLTDGRLARGFRQSPAIYNNKNGTFTINAPPRAGTVTTASVELSVFNEGDLTLQGQQRVYIECLRQTGGTFKLLTQFDTFTSDASCRSTQFAGGSVTGTGTFIRGLNCTACRLAPGPGVLTVTEPLILNQAQYEITLRARVGEDYDVLNVTARASITNSQTFLKVAPQFTQLQEGDEFGVLRFTDAVGSLDKPPVVLGSLPAGFSPRMVHRSDRSVVVMSKK